MNNKYFCTGCGHTFSEHDAKHCPRCGAALMEMANGEETLARYKRQLGVYLEGVLTVPLGIAVANVGTHFWAAFGSMAAILTLMLVIVPTFSGLVTSRKGHRRRAKQAAN